MKAARVKTYGVVEIVDIEKPTPGEGQVLIEVHASSVNPFDARLRTGAMQQFIPLELPFTLGGDVAGVVSVVGDGVTGFKVGDKVYGQAAAVAGNSGALAEFAATAAGQVAKMPAKVGFNEAASLVLVGVSALQALTEHIKLQSGQTILIHGGAGGIGSVAIQIAKHLGARVATTVSGADLEYAKKLGADEVIDYETQDFAQLVTGYDAVYDTVGGPTFAGSLGVLKSGGVAVTMAAEVDAEEAKKLGVTAIHQQTRTSTERLNRLASLIDSGVVTPHVAATFPLAQASAAYAKYEQGKVRGKVVVSIAQG
jgi:alcohol dehydrogenase